MTAKKTKRKLAQVRNMSAAPGVRVWQVDGARYVATFDRSVGLWDVLGPHGRSASFAGPVHTGAQKLWASWCDTFDGAES
jgi:hypothetical protein